MTTVNIPLSVFYFLALFLLIRSLSRTTNTANRQLSHMQPVWSHTVVWYNTHLSGIIEEVTRSLKVCKINKKVLMGVITKSNLIFTTDECNLVASTFILWHATSLSVAVHSANSEIFPCMQQQQQSLLNPFLNILELLKWVHVVFYREQSRCLRSTISAFSAANHTSLQLWSLPLFHILTTEILRDYLRNYMFRNK